MLLRLTIATVMASLALRAGTTLTVYLNAATVPAAETQSEMSREFAVLTASLDMDVRWQSYRDRGSAPATEYLLVVELHGSCDENRSYEFVKTGEILASAAVSDGQVLPFVQIDCKKVRSLMQVELRGRPTREQNQVLGRALARLLAHETYHVMAQSSDHAHHGVTKPQLRAAELVNETLNFDSSSRSRIEEKLSPPSSSIGDEDLGR